MRYLLTALAAAAVLFLPLVPVIGAEPVKTQFESTIFLPNSVVAENDGQKVELDLLISNFGPAPATPDFRAERLTINGVMLPELNGAVQRDITGLRVFNPGMTARLSYDISPYVNIPAVYVLAWVTPQRPLASASLRVRAQNGKFQPEEQSALGLMDVLRQKLPLGWLANYDPSYGVITVQRFKPTGFPALEAQRLPAKVGPMDSRTPRLRPVQMTLKVAPLMPPEEYARLAAENAAVDAERRKIQAQLGLPVGQGDYLLARTPGEAELVKKYNALSLARHALPGFSFRQAALSWTVPLSAFEVPDPEVKRECDTVETSVLSQLTPYARTGG